MKSGKLNHPWNFAYSLNLSKWAAQSEPSISLQRPFLSHDPSFEHQSLNCKQFGYIEYTLWDKIVPPANNWDHLLDSISESLFILFYSAWRDSRIYARRSLSSMRESKIKLCHIFIHFIILILAHIYWSKWSGAFGQFAGTGRNFSVHWTLWRSNSKKVFSAKIYIYTDWSYSVFQLFKFASRVQFRLLSKK